MLEDIDGWTGVWLPKIQYDTMEYFQNLRFPIKKSVKQLESDTHAMPIDGTKVQRKNSIISHSQSHKFIKQRTTRCTILPLRAF